MIEISELRGINWRVPYPKHWSKFPDGVGGWDVYFDPPKQWVKGDLLDLDLEVVARKRWFGHLSLEVVTAENRICVRREFCSA
jgi:hypothetical protein